MTNCFSYESIKATAREEEIATFWMEIHPRQKVKSWAALKPSKNLVYGTETMT